MVLVRLLGGQLEAQEGDDGGTGIGEVVHRVGGDGDGAAEDAGKELSCKEEEVQADAHAAAEDAVSPADRRRGDVFVVFYQMLGKEMDHCTPRSFLGGFFAAQGAAGVRYDGECFGRGTRAGYFFPGMVSVY